VSLIVVKTDRAAMPDGHTWLLVERDGATTAYVVDGAAERVARLVHAQAKRGG
jgi:hypothetical protein